MDSKMDSKTFDELLLDFNRLVSYIDEHDGEITPEVEQAMDTIQADLHNKLDKYLFVIQKLGHDASYYKDLSDQFYKRYDARQRTINYLKYKITTYLKTQNLKSLEGSMFRASVRPSPPRVIVFNDDIVPDEFVTISEIRRADKNKIKDYLRANPDSNIKWAKLEVGDSLIISTTRKE